MSLNLLTTVYSELFPLWFFMFLWKKRDSFQGIGFNSVEMGKLLHSVITWTFWILSVMSSSALLSSYIFLDLS